ncbi:heterokaryon incompatibility protein-domain-containing protein [Paraphoma chrysanthemicola]|uniref:Heterokaryon incompatibility protein-domain-containing protein n=1 Tax=Paraphoma chrysanthemicola TaxID=798071 RepID=A0A8K0VUV3_9PLEO|nr:heterokaryon incompatibility protein-domain-containing protein [Paraphoma chrysanthemicola]
MSRCALCNDQVKRNEDDPRLAFDFTPEQLIQSAFDQTCDSCLVILEGLRQSETPDWSFRRDIRRVYARCRSTRGSIQDTLRLEVYYVDDRPKLELEYYSLQAHPWKGILPRTSISGHPLSSQASDWVLSLLEQCKQWHTSCQHSARPLLPKRVILLNSTGVPHITARLFEPINQRSPYVALSHCWGMQQKCITTKTSIKQRKANIPWKTIPKTFQEVMQLALKLGFRYIWIDSLCIVQDDSEDWEVQSSLMSEIYQNAVLTLSATSAAGDNEGCCSNNILRPPLEITLPEDIGACQIAVRNPLQHWDAHTANELQDYFPLLTRGWAFQERLLSPRVLHICKSELVWECREASLCECGSLGQNESPGGTYHHAVENSQEEKLLHDIAQQGLADRMHSLELEQPGIDPLLPTTEREGQGDVDAPPAYEDIVPASRTNSSLSSDVIVGPSTNDEDILAFAAQSNVPIYEDLTQADEADLKDCPELVFHFHRVVEKYSALRLTRPTDRLPALSGLCKRVQHLRNNFLAGLWSDSICYDLLWRVDTIDLCSETNGARSLDYRGPTWSWISVNSPVSYWSDITNFRDPYVPQSYGPGHWHNLAPKAIEYTAAGAHADKIEMAVTVPGQNPFGTVTSAILTISASATIGTLRYTYDPHWLGGGGQHDPVRYKLEIEIARQDAKENIEVPFHADYSLGAPGPSNVPDEAKLTLLLIHPKVCLVLRPAARDVAPMVVNGIVAWERVGIARISDALVMYYRIDWMSGSEVRKFHIV